MGLASIDIRTAAVPVLLTAFLLLAAAAPSAFSAEPQSATAQTPGVRVIVTKARNACFSSTVHANGVLTARAEAMVIPEAEGFRIAEVNARSGDRVAAGQTLAQLSRADGARITLKSPTKGVVIESTASFGAVASPRAPKPLFRIAVDGDIELAASVPSIYTSKIAAGQTAQVEIEDGRELLGRVRRPPSEINPVSQLGEVRVTIENDPALRIGMFARATIDAARSCGVSVPRSAVYFRTEGASVQVVEDGVVHTRKIHVGLMSADSVEVKDGVKEGETIIANAGGSLRNGEKVRPMARDDTTSEWQER